MASTPPVVDLESSGSDDEEDDDVIVVKEEELASGDVDSRIVVCDNGTGVRGALGRRAAHPPPVALRPLRCSRAPAVVRARSHALLRALRRTLSLSLHTPLPRSSSSAATPARTFRARSSRRSLAGQCSARRRARLTRRSSSRCVAAPAARRPPRRLIGCRALFLAPASSRAPWRAHRLTLPPSPLATHRYTSRIGRHDRRRSVGDAPVP
jgi:hypothetical protein